VRSLASHLVAELSRVAHERSFQKPPDSLDAYDLLLRGRFVKEKRTREANAEAREFFEKAVARDPRFAAALAALGSTYFQGATEGWTEFYAEALDKAQQLAERALSIEPELAEGHQLLGDVYSARKDYDHALAELRKAIELNPSSASAYADEAWTLLFTGDSGGVIRAMETALKLDPALNFEDRHTLGFGYLLAERYEDAITVLEPLAAKNLFYFPYAGLAAAYAELGREADAKRAAAEVKRLWPFFTIADFTAQWRDPKAAERLAEGLRKAGLK
jgi:tetratricopeptide (TPR) repeat protein